MKRQCAICKKSAQSGKTLVRKGLPKKKGGTGSKVSRAIKRKFLPNLQKTRILLDNKPQRVYVCTKCMKKGKIVKA
ncbi:MAG: L28 family ribosomal protein [Candidatus Omnitrophota bacterium]